jgi:hypothetical protein
MFLPFLLWKLNNDGCFHVRKLYFKNKRAQLKKLNSLL